ALGPPPAGRGSNPRTATADGHFDFGPETPRARATAGPPQQWRNRRETTPARRAVPELPRCAPPPSEYKTLPAFRARSGRAIDGAAPTRIGRRFPPPSPWHSARPN